MRAAAEFCVQGPTGRGTDVMTEDRRHGTVPSVRVTSQIRDMKTLPTMCDDTPAQARERSRGGQLRKALDHVEQTIMDGLRHGFFECAISFEVVHGHKRQLVIRAGLETRKTTGTPCAGDEVSSEFHQ